MSDRVTELNDLDRPLELPRGWLLVDRDARLFARDRTLLHRLEGKVRSIPLAPDQLFHPVGPAELAIRRGKLRVSEFLPDGREITRAILQAGAVLRVLAEEGAGAAQAGMALGDTVLAALGEVELWLLPPGTAPGPVPGPAPGPGPGTPEESQAI